MVKKEEMILFLLKESKFQELNKKHRHKDTGEINELWNEK